MGRRKQDQKGEEKERLGDWSQRNQEEKMIQELAESGAAGWTKSLRNFGAKGINSTMQYTTYGREENSSASHPYRWTVLYMGDQIFFTEK